MNQVALVSQTPNVELADLSMAAAAIQKQVNRDVRRYWSDLPSCSVHAFNRLRDVPLGYWPVVIRHDIPYQAGGIHLNKANGQPYALVKYSDDWTITTSHESIEMLVDPSGNKTIAGDSVMPGQSRVSYLVEPCDPSESAEYGYTVNGILVSDFYTPAFFDPVQAPGVRYSYSGSIPGPRQVLEGGYLSWYDPIGGHVWQLFDSNAGGNFIDRGPLPGGFESFRTFADRNSAEVREKAMAGRPFRAVMLATISGGTGKLDESVAANADSLQEQIDSLAQ